MGPECSANVKPIGTLRAHSILKWLKVKDMGETASIPRLGGGLLERFGSRLRAFGFVFLRSAWAHRGTLCFYGGFVGVLLNHSQKAHRGTLVFGRS